MLVHDVNSYATHIDIDSHHITTYPLTFHTEESKEPQLAIGP